MKKIYYIYEHIRKDTNEVFYVGKGTVKKTNPYGRSQERTRRSNLWKKILNKTDYEIRIVFESHTEDIIFDKERELISKYGRKDLGSGPLVNLTDGGEGTSGSVRSDEFKRKVSEYHKDKKLSDNTKQLIRNKRAEQIITQEHRKNISQGLKGKTKGNPSPLKGIKRPKEVCEKIRKGKIGHEVSQETRLRISIKLKGNTRQTNPSVLDGTLERFITENPNMGYRNIAKISGVGMKTVLKFKQNMDK